MTTVLFVQGAFTRTQTWWWSKMLQPLEFVGLETAVVELPSCLPGGEGAGLADDVAVVTAALDARDEADGEVILLGQSYGGMVITGAGVHPLVTKLAYLTAAVPDEGESMASMFGTDPAPWSDGPPREDGTVGVVPAKIAPYFLQDCDPGVIPGALARLARQSARVFGEAPEAIAWKTKPAAYLVCAQDHATPPEVQRTMAAKLAGDRAPIELSTGHFPFLSQPGLLAGVLAQIDRTALDVS